MTSIQPNFGCQNLPRALAGVAEWIEHGPVSTGRWFNSRSGHLPGLRPGPP